MEQEINHLRSTSDRLAQQIQEIENQLKKNHQIRGASLERLDYWRREKEQADSIYTESISSNDEKCRELPNIEANFRECQEKLSACHRNLLLIEQANQLENSHFIHAEKNIQQLEARCTRLLNEQRGLIFIQQCRLTEIQLEIDQNECALHECSLENQAIENQISAADQLKYRSTSEIQKLQHELFHVSARFSALQNLQQKIDSNYDLITWQRSHQLHLLPRLWQKIQIQPEWENALEAVLRERLNSIEFEQLDLIQKLIKDVPSGKWVIFGKTQPWSPSIKRLTMNHTGYKKLISYITVDQSEILAVLEDWLCQIYVIEICDRRY